jgi:uncharacterized protein YaaW (UPF0174 family)
MFRFDGRGRAVDELRSALELATDDELKTLTDIMFSRKFNPLDYVCTPEPYEICGQNRQTWVRALEDRFRFLAADGFTVLQRKTGQVSYRQVLVQICRHLKLPYTSEFSVEELEAEILLALLERAWNRLPRAEQRVVTGKLQQALTQADLMKHIPPSAQQDPIRLLLKGSSAIAINSVVRPWVLQQITRQIILHAATYQTAAQTLKVGGAAIAKAQGQAAIAYRGMALGAARYSAVRGVFAVLGSAMWAWFFADLGWRLIATNYGRIIPVVFTLAQIRLMRSDCFEPAT